MTKHFIAIAGNIGVGKSSLVGLLAQRLSWTPFYEAVDENPYLSDFYQNMRSWSFHSQVFFRSKRLRHHRALLDHPAASFKTAASTKTPRSLPRTFTGRATCPIGTTAPTASYTKS